MEDLALITKHHKDKIVNGAVILGVLFIALAVYRNQVKNEESLRAKKGIEIKKNEAFLSIAESQEKAGLYKKNLAKKDASSVINTITGIAKNSNLKIIAVKPGTEEERPFYTKYPFTLVISVDSYHTFGKFIADIESYPAILFFIDRAELKPAEGHEGREENGRLFINLIISTVVFKN